jgi:anti-sigma B factor antagonist
MEVTEARADGTTTMRIVGRVDASVAQQLERKVMDMGSRDDHVVVDLQDMDYVSSAGLRVFIALAKQARSRNRKVALCAMQEDVREVFEITGLVELFAIHDSAEDAVAALPR